MAQATGSRIGLLLQSSGCRDDRPDSNRDWLGGLAMAARRRGPKGQLTAASDLRADFRIANLRSLLNALAPPRQEHLAGHHLSRIDVARADGNHAHRPSRWNP